MVRREDNDMSIQHRISSILARDRSDQRDFGDPQQAENVEEIEYLLARAEADLRKVQARVDELKRKLAKLQ